MRVPNTSHGRGMIMRWDEIFIEMQWVRQKWYNTLRTGEQSRLKSWGGPRFGSQHRGACWMREGVAPSRGEGPGHNLPPPQKKMKTQMLNPAFWWLLAVKFLAFWIPRPRSWGDRYIVDSPNLKVWGISLPRSLRLLRLWLRNNVYKVVDCFNVIMWCNTLMWPFCVPIFQ